MITLRRSAKEREAREAARWVHKYVIETGWVKIGETGRPSIGVVHPDHADLFAAAPEMAQALVEARNKFISAGIVPPVCLNKALRRAGLI